MQEDLDPIAGRWYRQVDKDQVFKVVGIDEDREMIEIQYANGEFEEIDHDAWSDLELEASDPPEGQEEDEDDDWRGSERSERDDHEWEDEDPDEDEDDDDDDDDDDWDDDSDSDAY
jgi:hypothetical protein